jgi:hypothetical protein
LDAEERKGVKNKEGIRAAGPRLDERGRDGLVIS